MIGATLPLNPMATQSASLSEKKEAISEAIPITVDYTDSMKAEEERNLQELECFISGGTTSSASFCARRTFSEIYNSLCESYSFKTASHITKLVRSGCIPGLDSSKEEGFDCFCAHMLISFLAEIVSRSWIERLLQSENPEESALAEKACNLPTKQAREEAYSSPELPSSQRVIKVMSPAAAFAIEFIEQRVRLFMLPISVLIKDKRLVEVIRKAGIDLRKNSIFDGYSELPFNTDNVQLPWWVNEIPGPYSALVKAEIEFVIVQNMNFCKELASAIAVAFDDAPSRKDIEHNDNHSLIALSGEIVYKNLMGSKSFGECVEKTTDQIQNLEDQPRKALEEELLREEEEKQQQRQLKNRRKREKTGTSPSLKPEKTRTPPPLSSSQSSLSPSKLPIKRAETSLDTTTWQRVETSQQKMSIQGLFRDAWNLTPDSRVLRWHEAKGDIELIRQFTDNGQDGMARLRYLQMTPEQIQDQEKRHCVLGIQQILGPKFLKRYAMNDLKRGKGHYILRVKRNFPDESFELTIVTLGLNPSGQIFHCYIHRPEEIPGGLIGSLQGIESSECSAPSETVEKDGIRYSAMNARNNYPHITISQRIAESITIYPRPRSLYLID